jgi:hypothetical protein
MNQHAILLPVFLQVALIAGLMLRLAFLRVRAVKRGDVRRRVIAIDNSAWPDHIRKVGNNVNNQFQLPVLFFFICVLLIATNRVTDIQVWLAWLFVASRFAHAWVHTGANDPVVRFYAFVTGFIALMAMWVIFGLGIAQGL